jgi:hypothetical protein
VGDKKAAPDSSSASQGFMASEYEYWFDSKGILGISARDPNGLYTGI